MDGIARKIMKFWSKSCRWDIGNRRKTELSAHGLEESAKLKKRECNSARRFLFHKRGLFHERAGRPEIKVSLRATRSDTSTFVLFTRVCTVVLQCICSLQPDFKLGKG